MKKFNGYDVKSFLPNNAAREKGDVNKQADDSPEEPYKDKIKELELFFSKDNPMQGRIREEE